MMQGAAKTFVLITAMLFSSISSAAVWNVVEVFNGSDGSFGFSGLHDSSGGTPMSGTSFGQIDSASGTYNDFTGELSLTLGITETNSSTDTFTLSGNLLFDLGGDGDLTTNSQLHFESLNLTTASASSVPTSGDFRFEADLNCCGGDDGPNTFLAANPLPAGFPADLHYMTLWGANITESLGESLYPGSTVGMDLRLGLSAVPVPAAFWLFGTALIGLLGFNRRRKAA